MEVSEVLDDEADSGADKEQGKEEKPEEEEIEHPAGPDPNNMYKEGLQQKEIALGAFRVENWPKAIEQWNFARGTMKHILEKRYFKDDEKKEEEVRNMETTLHNNLALAYLKNKEFHQALNFANKVLDREPENTKALYRKASAQIMGADFPEAQKTLTELLRLEPDNAGAKQLQLEAEYKDKQSKATGKKAAKKMFGKIENDPRTLAPPKKDIDLPFEEETWWEWLTDGNLDWMCNWCKRRKKAD